MKKLTILICISLLVFAKAFSQIPNNSFESWTATSGYQTPTSWDNLNQFTSSGSTFTCLKGTPGYVGASYLYLMTKNVPGKGIVPGVAVCGVIDTLTYKAKSGFPFTTRPQELTYYMQYMPYDPSDSSSVKVLLTKWNSTLSKRDTIASGETYFNGMSHSWIYRTTSLNYYSGDNPDSAIVVISSSDNGAFEFSYIYIDNMQFNGTVAGVGDYSANSKDLSVYPNPTSGNIFIEYSTETNENIKISIIDILGRTVYEFNSKEQVAGVHKLKIQSSLKNGLYTIAMQNGNSFTSKKIIINQ